MAYDRGAQLDHRRWEGYTPIPSRFPWSCRAGGCSARRLEEGLPPLVLAGRGPQRPAGGAGLVPAGQRQRGPIGVPPA